MKRLYWAGFVLTCVVSSSALGGCSSDPEPGGGTGGTGTAGTTGSTAGTGAAGASTTGTALPAPQYYTALTGADASPSTGTTPAKWNVCSVCHGANGQGVAGLGPELRHVNPTYAMWVIRNGRGGMTKYSTTDYSDAELTEILTWLGAMPKPTTPDGLYKDFCGTCHGPMNPTGGAVPVKISGLAKTAVTPFVRNGNGTDPSARNDYMPKFDATVLTDAELDQIQTFLGSTP